MPAQRTRSQQRIIKLLKTLNRALSAQEIYVELRRRRQNMGLATVYRSLEALKLQGAVQVRTLATGESLYASMQRDRHHLTCLNCGQSIPIDQCPVGELENQLQDSHGFKVYYHTLEFFGMCHQCQLAGGVDREEEGERGREGEGVMGRGGDKGDKGKNT